MTHWIRRWGPAILFMAVIFIASATPNTELPTLGAWDLLAKKGGHLLGYALLAAALFHALTYGRDFKRSHYILAVCIAILYAASDEYHQTFTPGRSATPVDVGIDAVGACLGPAIWIAIRDRLPARLKALIFQD